MSQEETTLLELGPRVEQCLFEENNDEAWSRQYVISYRALLSGGHREMSAW